MRQSDQGVGTDVHGQGKIRPLNVHKSILKRLRGGIRNRVDQEVDMAKFLAQLTEQTFNLFIFAHIAFEDERMNELFRNIAHHASDGLTLNGKGNPCASVIKHFSNRPTDGILIKHAND